MAESEPKRWCVYIVSCADGTLYTGATNNLDQRIEAHNSGNGARYTRSRRPVKLIYSEDCGDRSDALSREYAIKQLTRRQKLSLSRG